MIRKHYPCKLVSNTNNCVSFLSEVDNKNIKVYVLEENIIRVWMHGDEIKADKTWSVAPGAEDINPEGRDKTDLTGFSLPEYKVTEEDGFITIETNRLKAVIKLDGFIASWYTNKGGEWKPLFNDRKTGSYNFADSLCEGVCHYIERKEDDIHLGLGEKAGNVDKSIDRYIMKNLDPMGYDAEKSDPLYKHIPFYITKSNGLYYGLYYDTYTDCTFDLGRERDNYHGFFKYFMSQYGELDYYVIDGENLREVTQTFAWMGGETIFMPKWSLGYSGSTMTYTDAPNAAEMLLSFAEQCKKHDILCSSFQLSSGYTSIGDKRYVFNWNYDKVPNPKALSKSFEDAGIKFCANIKPALLIDHPQYEKLKANDMFIKSRDNSSEEVSMFWDELGAYVDFTNPETFAWWKSEVTAKLLEEGIASTWNDNNEFEVWDNQAKCNGFGKEKDIAYLKPVQTLLMMKASYEAQRAFDKDKRPYLISRSGCTGMQRYVQTWSGDNYTRWNTLRYNSKMGIGMTLSGLYNFGHDVGGFSGPKPEEELFVRWIQHGIFMPRFTIHSWNSDQTVNEPWMYEKATPVIRELIKFRYKIIPFYYDLMYRSYSEYEPMIRPLFYNFDDENIDIEADEYMIGENMLVKNVFDKGVEGLDIYLPTNGVRGWYDYHTGAFHKGGNTVYKSSKVEEVVPMFMQGDSVVAIDTVEKTFETKHDEKVAIEVFVAPGSGEFSQTIFNDDGESYGYKTKNAEWMQVVVTKTETSIEVNIKNGGEYAANKDLEVFVIDTDNRTVNVTSTDYTVTVKNR